MNALRIIKSGARITKQKVAPIARTVDASLRWLAAFIAITPTIMIAVATVGPTGQTLAKWFALAPIVAVILMAIAIRPTLSIGAGIVLGAVNWGTKKFFKKTFLPTTRSILTWITIGVVVDCLIATYLSLVPIYNDRGLVLPLVFVALAWTLLFILNWWAAFRTFLLLIWIGITITFLFGGRAQAADQIKHLVSYTGQTSNNNIVLAAAPSELFCSDEDAAAQDNSTDATNAAAQLDSSELRTRFNNPLNIKWSRAVEDFGLGASDSGVQAADGGTWAQFPTPDAGLRAAYRLLDDDFYRNFTVEQAMRKWSYGFYGAEIVRNKIDGRRTIGSLSAAELDTLVSAMLPREGSQIIIGRGATAPDEPLGPDDHRNDHIARFDVTLRGDCFPLRYVRVPNFWRSWEKELISQEPDRNVSFWFFGSPRPQGPYGPNNIPEFNSPPAISMEDPHAEWRVRGKGTLRYVQTS